MSPPLGFSGRLARRFLGLQLTPLLAVAALLAGVFAVLITPREEEPQIDVTFANVFVAFPGASAEQVENLVASPMEKVLGEIAGVEHIASASRPGMAVLSVQFKVGEPRNEAIVRLYNAIYSNQDWQPPNSGVLQPLVKPKGIDDVPVVTLTLWTQDPARGAYELAQVARSIEAEIKRVPGTRNVYSVGGPRSVVRVDLDAQKLSGFGLTVDELTRALQAANVVQHAGSVVGGDQVTTVDAGRFLADRDDVAGLVVGAREGKPVFLEDVASHQRRPRAAGFLCLARNRSRRRGARHSRHRACARGHDRDLQEARRKCHRRRRPRDPARRTTARHVHSRRRRGDRHPQLRRDGQRQGEEAHPETAVRHCVGGVVSGVRHGAARGHRGRRRDRRHSRRDAVRVLGLGLHHQPRVAVRADLLDRHPGRRRHRHRREHPSSHAPAGKSRRRFAGADHSARGRRSGRTHHPRDLHRHRGIAAHGIRERPHGSIHEPDPHQQQHGHAHLAGRGADLHALAVPQAAQPARACGRPREWRESVAAQIVRALPASVSRRRRRHVASVTSSTGACSAPSPLRCCWWCSSWWS